MVYLIGIVFYLLAAYSNFKNHLKYKNSEKYENNCLKCLSIFFIVIAGIFVVVFFENFFSDMKFVGKYAELKGDKQEILSLKKGIKNVKELKDLYSKEGTVVSGNVANIFQLQETTKYISEYQIKKANYNKKLAYYKELRKHYFYYSWFHFYFFIPRKIFNLEHIQ